MDEANARIRKLEGTVTVTLKASMRELRLRIAIGTWLIKLGCRVIGLNAKIETEIE